MLFYNLAEAITSPFVILIKLTYIGDYLLLFIVKVFSSMCNKQISKGIATPRWSNYCQMSLPLRAILEIRKFDYISERTAIKNILLGLFWDSEDISQLRGKTLTIETNKLMYKSIDNKSNPYRHLMILSEPKKFTGIQPFEKLKIL